MQEIIESINALKKSRNAILLAHLYQWPQIQDIADFVGDSLDLSRKAHSTEADVIVFCGVKFMAESAKILSPQKTVVLPAMDAGCPMADMVTPEDVERLRKEHPKAAVVCYVNSSADVKAVSDICCTSSNAVKVTASLKEDEIIFIPDKNLGHYVSRFLQEKRFIFFHGFCHVHERISTEDVSKARAAKPGALVLVHPECRPDVVDAADFVGSTAQIMEYTMKSEHSEFLIGTECGILHRLNQLSPDKRFYALGNALLCPNMKKTTLQGVLTSLETLQNRIELDPQVIAKASRALDRMLRV